MFISKRGVVLIMLLFLGLITVMVEDIVYMLFRQCLSLLLYSKHATMATCRNNSCSIYDTKMTISPAPTAMPKQQLTQEPAPATLPPQQLAPSLATMATFYRTSTRTDQHYWLEKGAWLKGFLNPIIIRHCNLRL